jgi:hypothetical protein
MKNKKTISVDDADDRKIDELVKTRARELMELEPSEDNERIFYMKLKQAQFGSTYRRDREIMKRVMSGQVIRVVGMISNNPEERKKYIFASMPEINLLPETG